MADKELSRVRLNFVGKVSKGVLKDLLDGLLEDGVLNEGEVESILEENSTKKDKARSLIDSVRMKGSTASRKMIVRLEIIDPTLYSELGLSCGQLAQPDGKPQKDEGSSFTPTSSIESFWKTRQNDPDTYPVTKTAFGNRVALLITNIKFSVERLNRNGAERDEENMEKLLSSFGYEVVKHRNLSAKEIDDAIMKFSKHPKLRETDSVFVVIMSHGKLGAVCGVESEVDGEDDFPINRIYDHLSPQKCTALLDKPKVIIIQACRGGEKGGVLVGDSINQPVAEEDFEDDTLKFVHKEKDFISLLSSTPDTVSYRHTHLGSLLIQYINEVFNESACKDPIQELFRKVMLRFESFQNTNKLQMATVDRCTLTRHFYLYPGL
ncbi:caspase-1-like [Menidia menidia]